MKRIIASLVIAGLVIQHSLPLYGQAMGKISIAIMDFQNTSGKPDLDYLQKSIPEVLVTKLASSGKLNLVERTRLQDALREMRLGMAGVVDESQAIQVGRALGASAILVGSFVEISGLVRINARLIEVQTSRVMKAESVQGQTGREMFSLMDQLAKSIENQLLRGSTPTTQAYPPTPPPPPPEEPTIPAKRPESRITPQEKGGSKAGLYILGGVLIAGGVAAAVLLSGGGDDNGGGGVKNSKVTVNVEFP